jgi:putative peptidoglycan lipid II flippase
MAVAVNLGAGLLLMGPMLQGGLALATSLAAAVNILILFVILVRRLGDFPTGELLVSITRISAASAVMGAVIVYVLPLGNWARGLTASNFGVLLGCVSGGLAAFVASAHILRCREQKSLLSFLRDRGS